MLVDSHCHLDHLDLSDRDGGLSGVIHSAEARGVTHFLSVAVDIANSRSLIDLTAEFDNVYSSVGVHPLQKTTQPVPSVEELISLAQQPRVVAIGETGLDNFYSSETIDWQRQSFINHLQASQQIGKPVIIHTRDAREETIQLMREYTPSRWRCDALLYRDMGDGRAGVGAGLLYFLFWYRHLCQCRAIA